MSWIYKNSPYATTMCSQKRFNCCLSFSFEIFVVNSSFLKCLLIASLSTATAAGLAPPLSQPSSLRMLRSKCSTGLGQMSQLSQSMWQSRSWPSRSGQGGCCSPGHWHCRVRTYITHHALQSIELLTNHSSFVVGHEGIPQQHHLVTAIPKQTSGYLSPQR